MSSPWLRLGAALGLSALLHAVVLLLLRAPQLPSGADFQINVLIVPLERPAPPEAPAAAGARPKAEQQKERGAKLRSDAPARPAPAEPSERRRVSASISAGPISPPLAALPSGLADSASYVDAERLPSYPRLAAPLVARYPRQAFEQRRKAVVVLQLMIDESGKVAEALALPGAGEEFIAAALEALRGARFAPGQTASGKPVRARAYFAVSFVIE